MMARVFPALVLATGCAATPEADPLHEEIDPSVEETLVYLETLKPPTVESVRFREPLRYDVINVRFVYLDVKDGRYLIEMARDCKPLKSNEIYTDMADRRSIRGRIRAGVDTIRGCRIQSIYELPAIEETPAGIDGPTEATNETGNHQAIEQEE